MVAFAAANLPIDIDTVEKLASWALSALYQAHGADRVQEIEGIAPVPAVEWTLINAPGGILRVVGRVSFEVDKLILTDITAKPWTRTKAFPGNLPLPPGYAAA